LVTMVASLAVVGLLRVRAVGFERGGAAIAALACAVGLWLVTSRSVQSLWLRVTSEGQGAWDRADIGAPPDLTFDVGGLPYVSLEIATSGRVTWASTSDQPFYFSYHWLDATGDRVVAYEGGRTPFDRPMTPGARATMHPLVRAPRVAGTYQLAWDVVQEDRL